GVIIAIIFAAVFFQPIKDWMQVQLDRQFYRERFDYRRTLEEFARELSSEVRLDRLMEKLLDRLTRTLPVERMAIFLEDEKEPGVFRLARAQGLGRRPQLAFHPTPGNALSSTVTLDDAWSRMTLPPAHAQALARLDLHYLVPCCVQDRTIGFLALGKTVEGGLLSSEDVTLLESLADYLAIAMENARLYRSVEQKVEQIAQLQEFSENILESTSVGLVALDPQERIESWNSTMERLTGRPRAEVLGHAAAAVFPAELVRELEARRGEAVQSSIYKFYLADAAGRRRVLNIAIAPLVGKQGRPIGRLLVFDDITERIQLESQLLQNEKLTSMGLLAAGVAHEVNTPLAVISNYAQLLAKQTPGSDTRAAMIEKIIKQTFRASEIISGLLNFSRTGPSEFTRVDLNRTLADTLALVEPQLRSSKVEIRSALEPSLPPVQGDNSKLQQVFLNLFFNARDAMQQGGRLFVRTRCADAKVEVEISDTGVGIQRDDVGKIFDPFFTTKSTGRGTGLGLAITYGIMQEHHGSIEVRSYPGQGATFVLVFPAPSGAAAGQSTTAGQPAVAGKPATAGKLQGGNRG
ncbi:MAG: ATP-binding protein, partial [Terriglobia bacterium]